MNKPKKILFLGPYPAGFGPSQRFRIEVYLPSLEGKNLVYNYATFYSEKAYQKLYSKGNFLSKSSAVLWGLMKRFFLLFTVSQYDYVFIQREITPVGPPIIEWCIIKLFKAKVIYDFDDAIWLPNFSQENALFHRLKYYSKIKRIIKWSDIVVAGNRYLQDYALNYNTNTIIIPTVIDSVNNHNPELYTRKVNEKLTIGWTGTLTNNLHIESLKPVFARLNLKYDYQILLISNKKPSLHLPNVRFEHWDKSNEIEQLMQADIGLMPLKSNEDFYTGKCGFKAIQYMSLGIITVATPLGFNKELIDENINGYFATTIADWHNVLERLLKDEAKNNLITKSARKKVIESYSVNSQIKTWLTLFQ